MFENINISETIAWIVSVAIPAGIAIWQAFKAGGFKSAFNTLCNLMTENVPMDESQTKLIESGKVPEGTWKMSDERFEEMCTALEKRDILVNKTELRDLITKAEAGNNVDYGILICGKDGNVDESLTHLYISYGTPMYQTRAEVEHNATVNSSSIFKITVYWYMTELRKMLLLSEIQMNSGTEKCVNAAIAKIDSEELKQTETYTITCNQHWWVVTKGKVVENGSGAKDTTV